MKLRLAKSSQRTGIGVGSVRLPSEFEKPMTRLQDEANRLASNPDRLPTSREPIDAYNRTHTLHDIREFNTALRDGDYVAYVWDWTNAVTELYLSIEKAKQEKVGVERRLAKGTLRRNVTEAITNALTILDKSITARESQKSPEGIALFDTLRMISHMRFEQDPQTKQRSLSQEDMKKIDAVFGNTDLAGQAEILTVLINSIGRSREFDTQAKFKEKQKQGFTPEGLKLFTDVGDRMEYYLGHYYNLYLQHTFWPNDRRPVLDGYPKDARYLPVASVHNFERDVKYILPSGYEDVIRRDFIPGLSEELKADIITAYEAKFAASRGGLNTLESKNGYHPYELAQASFKNGQAKEYITRLVNAHSTDPNLQADLHNRLKTNFDHITDVIIGNQEKENFTQIPIEPGNELIAHMEVAVARFNFIDVFFISPTHEALVLQVDADGRIVGIPPGYKGDMRKLGNYVIGALVDHFEKLKPEPKASPAPASKAPRAIGSGSNEKGAMLLPVMNRGQRRTQDQNPNKRPRQYIGKKRVKSPGGDDVLHIIDQILRNTE